MSQAVALHPFLALMKRYCIDYTNSHDTSWLPEIMTDDYVVRISGQSLVRSEGYQASVEALFREVPGLTLTIHEIYCNGERLAMRFSEHARWQSKGNALTAWRGFSTYEWDGTRLSHCWVEQDFYSRQRQIKSGVANPVQTPALDPWMTPITPADQRALAAASAWLENFDLARVPEIIIDDSFLRPDWILEVIPEEVRVNDVFSAGRDVPFHVDLTGPLRRNPAIRESLAVCGIISLDEDYSVARVNAVTDRMTLAARDLIAQPAGKR